MTNFLLVHGEWHNASMWDDVTRHLRNSDDGTNVGDITAVDLPGHGSRRSFDISRITVDYYVNAVVTPPRVNLREKRDAGGPLLCRDFHATGGQRPLGVH